MAKRNWKVGDKFTTEYSTERFSGSIFKIISSDNIGMYPYKVKVIKKGKGYESVDSVHSWNDDEEGDMVFIKNNKLNMSSIIEKFKLLTKAEPDKSFIKAEITEMDGSFTTDGRMLFEQWQLEKNKVAFNAEVAQPILEAKKEEDAK